MSYRAPPSMPGIVRPPPPGPITPEYLVDRYMSQNSPRALGSHRKAPEPPSDPESWWKLYVLSTHVRGAATLQQSFRKEAWANSRLRSPRQPPGTPRSGGGMPPHSRSGRPAPQLPRHRTAAQAFAIAESFIPEVMEMYSLDLQQNKNQQNFPPPPKPGPPTMSRPGRPASPRVEGLAGHRAAPKMPGKRASTAELNHAQKLIVQKLTDRCARKPCVPLLSVQQTDSRKSCQELPLHSPHTSLAITLCPLPSSQIFHSATRLQDAGQQPFRRHQPR